MIDIEDSLSRDMRINLGGCQLAVSQQFLNASKVGSAVEQMGGEAVSEGVGAGVVAQSRAGEVFLQKPANASGAETVAISVEEQSALGGGGGASQF